MKQYSDLRAQKRNDDVELTQLREKCASTAATCEEQETALEEMASKNADLQLENESISEDLVAVADQLEKEVSLRKGLQHERRRFFNAKRSMEARISWKRKFPCAKGCSTN